MIGLSAAPLRYATDYVRLSLQRSTAVDYANLAGSDGIRVADLLAAVGDEEWREVSAESERLMARRPGAIGGGGSLNPGDRRVVYCLVRALKPARILEIGTHLGSSMLHMAMALSRNGREGSPGRLTTVDIRDVNAGDGAWARAGAHRSPREMIEAAGLADRVRFVVGSSVDFLAETDETFDFCFLDGSHAAHHVFAELQALPGVLNPGAFMLLHDYFPGGRPLWPDREPISGPYLALQRLMREGASVTVLPLGTLPWPTKAGTRVTSLALVLRARRGLS